MTKFVVFGQQRTGTTLIISLLQSHPDILSMGELFDNKEGLASGATPTYKLYIKNKNLAPNSDYDSYQHKDTIKQYLDTVFLRTAFDAVGFKLMMGQVKRYPMVQDYLKIKQFKVILVIRKNLLETSVSKLRARETGIYDSKQPIFDSTKHRKLKIRIPVELLLKELNYTAKQNEELQTTVLNLGLDYITVIYEEFIKNPGEMHKILGFLEVKKNIELKTLLQKVSPPSLKDSIENYEEIVQAIKNTPYATYLELQ